LKAVFQKGELLCHNASTFSSTFTSLHVLLIQSGGFKSVQQEIPMTSSVPPFFSRLPQHMCIFSFLSQFQICYFTSPRSFFPTYNGIKKGGVVPKLLRAEISRLYLISIMQSTFISN